MTSSGSDERMSVPCLRWRRGSRTGLNWRRGGDTCRRRWRLRPRWSRRGRRLDACPVLQLRDPHCSGLVLPGELAILLEVTERIRRLIKVEIAKDASIAVGGGVCGICRDRVLVGLLRILELAAQSLHHSELGPGERAVRVAR